MTDLSNPSPPAETPISPALVKAAGYSWRIIVVAAMVVLVAVVFFQLRVVTVPIFLALLATTLLLPPAKFLQSKGFKPALATSTVFLAVVVFMAGLIYLLSSPIQSQFSSLGPQVGTALDDVNNWLVTGPLGLDAEQIDRYRDTVQSQITDNASALGTGVVHSATLAAEIFAGFLLSIVLTFFFVKDGSRLAHGIIRRFPLHRQALVKSSAERAFHTLGGYLRGVALTGFVDAFFIGIALFFIGVPLILPLIVLTFFGAFFPVVGATAAGALAAAIALVNGGPGDALLVILVVLAVQQLEGHILQPLLVGRAVALHPVVIIIALGSGAVIAGLLGAFVAVPLAAVIGAVWREIDEQEDPVVPEEGEITA